MSQFQGRRAPNVSQYIANLNTIPPATDATAQPTQEFPNFEDELAMFTNTQFFDFDVNDGDMTFGGNDQQRRSPKNMPFVNQSGFPYNEFGPFPNQQQQQPMLNHPSPNSLPPSPPNGIQNGYPAQQSQPTVPSASAFAVNLESGSGEKRTHAQFSGSSPGDLEEGSRVAAEEDKRRRNTAASARFRVKKKQREQALEKTAKEMSDKVQILEARIGQLEMENKWLKGLITEKNLNVDTSGGPPSAAADAHEVAKAIAAAKAVESKAEVDEDDDDDAIVDKLDQQGRNTQTRTDGVGTGVKAVEA